MSNIILRFDLGQTNVLTDEEYLYHDNRLDGFHDISESKLFNKILMQVSGVTKSFVDAVENINAQDITDLNNLFNEVLNSLNNNIIVNLKRECQAKFRYDILKSEINSESCRHAFMNGITDAELSNSYGLGYALALYAGVYISDSDFKVLKELDKLDDIKNSTQAISIIKKIDVLDNIWKKYAV